MTDTDALIELLDKASDNEERLSATMYLQSLAPDLAREVIALRAEIARLTATVERVRAAIVFVEPVDRVALNSAIASDIAAGMSLRKAAFKHGTTLSIARRAALTPNTGDKDGV